jgi:hypothetical protein
MLAVSSYSKAKRKICGCVIMIGFGSYVVLWNTLIISLTLKKHYPSRPHWMFFRDSYKNFDLYNNPCFQKYTLESKMLQDNFNYWMMMLDWYDSRFKHFFVLDWCADYYNFTKFKKIARRDWKESVLDFFIRQLQDRNNLTRNQSLAVANRLMEAYGGHLNADQQSDMLTHHILRNPRLLSLLDS